MNKEKIIQIIVEELKKMGYTVVPKNSLDTKDISMLQQKYKSGFFTQQPYIKSYTSLPKGKRIITEYEIRQMLKQNPSLKEIVLPEDAILGPLAEDFINFHQIKIIRKRK